MNSCLHKVLLLICLFCCTKAVSQSTILPNELPETYGRDTLYDAAAILWRGFTHQWSYNHRLNRLGSYIENPPLFTGFPFTAQLSHTSATGLGPDVGTYTGYYSYVAANGVVIESGKKDLRFSGNLGDMHTASFEVLADVSHSFALTHLHHVVINGFDIVSERQADKLQMFRLSVSNGVYIPATNQIRFTVDAALLVRCQSVECNLLSDKFEYAISIHYLIFSGSQQTLFVAEQATHHVYNWDKRSEVQFTPANQNIVTGIGNNLYPTAVLAFKSINITLDRPHWFVAWHSAIKPIRYDARQGMYQYELDLLFKQWVGDMKKGSAFPSKSRFSIKRNGWAAIDGTILMLQFADAFVHNTSSTGAFKWEGKNLPATADNAINTQDLVFDADIFLKDPAQFKQSRLLEEARAKQLYLQYLADLQNLKEQRKLEKDQRKQQERNNNKDKR